jgi:hypothetical protein
LQSSRGWTSATVRASPSPTRTLTAWPAAAPAARVRAPASRPASDTCCTSSCCSRSNRNWTNHPNCLQGTWLVIHTTYPRLAPPHLHLDLDALKIVYIYSNCDCERASAHYACTRFYNARIYLLRRVFVLLHTHTHIYTGVPLE